MRILGRKQKTVEEGRDNIPFLGGYCNFRTAEGEGLFCSFAQQLSCNTILQMASGTDDGGNGGVSNREGKEGAILI